MSEELQYRLEEEYSFGGLTVKEYRSVITQNGQRERDEIITEQCRRIASERKSAHNGDDGGKV